MCASALRMLGTDTGGDGDGVDGGGDDAGDAGDYGDAGGDDGIIDTVMALIVIPI